MVVKQYYLYIDVFINFELSLLQSFEGDMEVVLNDSGDSKEDLTNLPLSI